MTDWRKVEGYLLDSEIPILQEYCKGKNVLEIGSFKGKSACVIAPVAKSLVCVDTFKVHDNGRTQDGNTLDIFKQNTKEFDNVRCVVGDSIKVIPRKTKKNSFDVVFIDGGHLFPEVSADIKVCWPKLKIGGIVIFHDTDWNAEPNIGGVWKAIITHFDTQQVQKNINLTSISIVKKTQEYLKGT